MSETSRTFSEGNWKQLTWWWDKPIKEVIPEKRKSWKLKNMVAVRQVIHSQKMKFYIKDFFSKCDLILSFLQIWSHLLKKSFIHQNFIFCVVFEAKK